MLLLAFIFSIVSLISFFLRHSTYFAFAALIPCTLGSWMIVLNPQFEYIDVSFTTVMCLLLLSLILLFFDWISHLLQIKGRLQFARADRYIWIYVFLGIGILGFIFKLFLHVSGVGLIGSLVIITSQPEKYSKIFSSGFSLMHYTGYIGLVYFALLKPKWSLPFIGSVILTIIYLFTLFLLFIKVQVVIGIYILFWTYVFASNNPKKVIIKAGLLILFFGLIITAYDNYKVSQSFLTAYEFLIRYLAGSIIALSEFISSTRQMESFSFEGYFFGRYNPILPYLGIETISFPEKTFYKIGANAGTTNTGTIVQSLMVDFGNVGWIIGLFIFPLTIFSLHLTASKSMVLTEFIFPFLIISQVGFSLIHMGNSFWKLELILISLLHISIVSIQQIVKCAASKTANNSVIVSAIKGIE